MNTSLRELFRDVVDVTGDEREKILEHRRVSTDVRVELESLLRHDAASDEPLSDRLAEIAREALHWGNAPSSRFCGPYRLIRLLGSGGMGAVYLAERRDGEIEQKVAIKLLRADSDRPAWRDRFLRERQLLAYLNHPSIARLLDAGHTDDGLPYLVMEYVDGAAIDACNSLDLRAQLKLFLLVCEGVSHAHRHLIVHRDLKPSNILVDASGHPKLLDFGIAKLLDDTGGGETRTVERLLTPQYASPEQIRGDTQSTATDIYSLGAVLYRLLTGRPPQTPFSQALTGEEAQSEHITTPSRLNPKLPRDIDHILGKALRYEPSERYASVDAFAEDICAFLESRPVQARSAATWYRTGKFLRRYKVAVTAASVVVLSLFLGTSIAKHQREIAERRLKEVREFTSKFLALDEVMDGLHGSSRAMHEMIAMSGVHVDTLAAAARKDRRLALEAAQAYSNLARGQGICSASSSEQHARAERSLQNAASFVGPVLEAEPHNRRALLLAATISHDGMIVSENEGRNDEALARAGKAASYMDILTSLGELSTAESEKISEFFYHLALTHKNLQYPEKGIPYAKRSIEIARLSAYPHWRTSLAQSMFADLLRLTGNLEGAYLAIKEARANLEKAEFPNETERRASWSRVLGREGKILGAGQGINLNRPDEAAGALQQAFNLIEEWAQNDREDAWSRLLFASSGGELGSAVSLRDPQRALAVYNHALQRLAEVKNNLQARRGEAELLAGSSYALRRLNRVEEARNRIENALRLLSETKDYPADRVDPYEAAHITLRALGDHLAQTGEPEKAADIYEQLLAKISQSKAGPHQSLTQASALSEIYTALAALHRDNGQRTRSREIATRQLELWRHWREKLPASTFVGRQFELARRQFHS